MKAIKGLLLSCCVLSLATFAQAQPITIDNGVTGDGQWQVQVQEGGDSNVGILDPAGPIGPNNVIFDLLTFVDAGANGGAIALSDTTITGHPALTAPGQVSSSGTFAGANGPVNWNSVSRIATGSLVYQNNVTFTSANPFGTLRVICYLDEDVMGSSDDIMVLFGTPGQADFNVLTVDNTDNFGVAHAAGYLTATNATYVGYAADEYAHLISAIANEGTVYSIPGVIDTTSLPPLVDPRYPGRMVFGPNDITNAFAFDLSPTATTASVACSLGGLPTGQPPALTISKTAAATAVNGTDLVYTIRYANAGAAASGVSIRDRLPMGATFVSASNGGTLAGDTVTWAIGDLPANSGDRTLTLTVRVMGVGGSVITNSDYSISGTGISMVAGAPVSTTLTAATVVIPPVTADPNACAVVPLPDAVRASAEHLSSDANFVFLLTVPDPARIDARCATIPAFCTPVVEVSAYDRVGAITRPLTTNSASGWDVPQPITGNRAWLATSFGVSFTYSGRDLASVNYGTVPARDGKILLANAATGAVSALQTPLRTASTAAGLSWTGHLRASAYSGNRVILVEAAYDSDGHLVDGGLNVVDIAMQTSFDLVNRIRDVAQLPDAPLFFGLGNILSMSGDGNRVSFTSSIALTGPNKGTSVLSLPGNTYRLRELAYVLDIAANSLTLVAQPDLSQARVGAGSSLMRVRELGATGTLVVLGLPVPLLNTPGNPDQNSEIYVAQPGIGVTQVTNTMVPPITGNYLSPGSLATITPNERFVYFDAEQDLIGRNADRSNELYRFDIQTGRMRQVTTRFDARADLLAALGITDAGNVGNELVGFHTSFDGRFVLMYPTGPATTVAGGSVVFEQPTLFDCQ